jgi:hypothetical protein
VSRAISGNQPEETMDIRDAFARALAVASCIAWLSGCDGHSSASQPAAPVDTSTTGVVAMLQAQVASGALPTLDVTSSVTGTDTDKNGVRDDIDAIIAKQVDTSAQRAALTQFAQSIEATLTLDATDKSAVATIATEVRKAIACVFTQYDPKTAEGRVRWLEEISINTMPRLQAYDHFNIAMNNSVTPQEMGAVCNA